MSHFHPKSPPTIPAPRPHPPRSLQHSPSLPNLWLPPRDGPIPAHISRPPAHHNPPSDPLTTSPFKSSQKLPSRSPTDPLQKAHKSHYLTPPLTPSSSLRSDSTDHESTNPDKPSNEKPTQTRFLIVRNVPKDISESNLCAYFTTLASSCDFVGSSSGEASLLRPHSSKNVEADQFFQVINLSLQDRSIVVLALYDSRNAQRIKSVIEESRVIDGKGMVKQTALVNDIQGVGCSWEEGLTCAFLAQNDFAEFMSQCGSSGTLIDNDFVLSTSECHVDSSHTNKHIDGISTENRLLSPARVKSVVSAHGNLRQFRVISNEKHCQRFLVDYHDIRATQSALNDLDSRIIENTKFSIVSRYRFGEDAAKDSTVEAEMSLHELIANEYTAEPKIHAAPSYATTTLTPSTKSTSHMHFSTDVAALQEAQQQEQEHQPAVNDKSRIPNTGNRRNAGFKQHPHPNAGFTGFRSSSSSSSIPAVQPLPDEMLHINPAANSMFSRSTNAHLYPNSQKRSPVEARQVGNFQPPSMYIAPSGENYAGMESSIRVAVDSIEVPHGVQFYYPPAAPYYYPETHNNTPIDGSHGESMWYYSDVSIHPSQQRQHPVIPGHPIPSPTAMQRGYWESWGWMPPDHIPSPADEWGQAIPSHHHPPYQPVYYHYPIPVQHPGHVYQPQHVSPYPVPPVSFPTAPQLSPGSDRNQLDLRKLENGSDTRTTVMVKNIPNKMTDKELHAFIDNVCHRKIDFLYLRMDFQNGCNVGYAFVNFMSVQDLYHFAKTTLGKKWNVYSSEKVLQMSYANYQGKEALVEKFKNSCIMDEIEEWRPKIFYSDGPNKGLAEPFPKPTHIKRKERSSYNRGALFVPGIHAPSGPRRGYLNSTSHRAPSQRSQRNEQEVERDGDDG